MVFRVSFPPRTTQCDGERWCFLEISMPKHPSSGTADVVAPCSTRSATCLILVSRIKIDEFTIRSKGRQAADPDSRKFEVPAAGRGHPKYHIRTQHNRYCSSSRDALRRVQSRRQASTWMPTMRHLHRRDRCRGFTNVAVPFCVDQAQRSVSCLHQAKRYKYTF